MRAWPRLSNRPWAAAFAVSMLTASAGHAADPKRDPAERVPLPRLEATTAHESQAAWMAVKGLGSGAKQADAVEKRRLLRKACEDLVDLRPLVDGGVMAGFDFRDNVRGRSWSRPTLALVLSEAMKRFRAELPGRALSIGDVSQPGCGQIFHGVIVQELSGEAATKLVASARLELSEPTLTEVKRAKDFPWESDRFGPPEERVLVTTRILGKSADGARLRTARTRHRELAAPSTDEVKALEVALAGLTRGAPASSKKVESEDGAGVREVLWATHFIAPESKRQALIVTRQKPGRRLDWADVVEVRLASWQDKKPLSFPDEVRWVVRTVATPVAPAPAIATTRARNAKKVAKVPTPIEAVTFERWGLLYEAGHITHLSGIDVDLSYVTLGDQRHFAVDLAAMDVTATWRWLEIVEETARGLGTPVDAILVDAKIKRHFEQNLPKQARQSKPWHLLAIVGGHDAHHHLRIVEGTPAQEKAARKRLFGK